MDNISKHSKHSAWNKNFNKEQTACKKNERASYVHVFPVVVAKIFLKLMFHIYSKKKKV